MNYLDIANSKLLYLLAGILILYVIIICVIFLYISIKKANALGIKSSTIRETVVTSAVFSIVPSIPIVLSLIAIAPVLGLPFSWMRLSVIGSSSYELIAADIGAKSMGIESLGGTGYTPQVFTNSMWVMSIGIIWGLVLCVFALKFYEKKLKTIKSKDSRWGEILISALFFGMLSVFLGRPITSGGASLYVLLMSGLIMAVLTFIGKKTKVSAIQEFSLPVSMIGGMAFAILLANMGVY